MRRRRARIVSDRDGKEMVARKPRGSWGGCRSRAEVWAWSDWTKGEDGGGGGKGGAAAAVRAPHQVVRDSPTMKAISRACSAPKPPSEAWCSSASRIGGQVETQSTREMVPA